MIGLAFAALAFLAADAPVLRYVPQHGELKYTFGGAVPTHHVKPGTKIVSWTEDCFDGVLTKPGQKPSEVTVPGHDNPQTGPFYVDGAEPGDTLAIHIDKLEPARDYGVSVAFAGFGALKGTDKTAMLGPDLPETVWFYSVDRAKGVARTKSQDGKSSWEVPLAPFLGCLGVSPAYGEARSTIVPDSFGGNMDCPEVRAGNTIYLGVRVPGGLFSFGDGHYAMGDGEIMGTAIEGAMNVELTVDLIKHRETPWPRIENDDWIMSVGAARPLEDAARIAFKDMVRWVQEKTGLSEMDAYEFVSQNAKAPITEIVDPEYTVTVKVPKSRLPAPASPAKIETAFRWPVPEGWKQETIPFPLDFAKDLPYRGVEELRFSPGMFDPSAEGFWSYAFVWWLDGKPELGAVELQAALKRYFAGLSTEVARDKGFPIDPARFKVALHELRIAATVQGHAARALTGTIDSYDAFATGKPIVLNADIRVWDCPASGKRAALVLVSPKPSAASVWTSLRERRDAFACH